MVLRACWVAHFPVGLANGRSDCLWAVALDRDGLANSTPLMDGREETRELPDVTIRAQETSPGFVVASYHPTSPETHPARQGFSIDTKRGSARGIWP